MEKYSVLMSVYYKDNPIYFDESLKSIFSQTIMPNDIVLVCDGPLTNDLEFIIDDYIKKYPHILYVKRLDKNGGLGAALRFGLPFCKNKIVLRADSDDISLPNRAEKQIRCLLSGIDVCSSNVALFEKDIQNICGFRKVPQTHNEIVLFSKKRSPFNHPSIAFLKDKVLQSGGYLELKYREDWFLWVRMIQKNCRCCNIAEELVLMRENPSTFKRRSNKEAFNSTMRLLKYMKNTKYISLYRYIVNLVLYFLQYIMPHKLVEHIYKKWLHK